MDATQVVDVVRNVHFMPGWEFNTLVMAPYTVMVRVTWRTHNSNQDRALAGYPETVHLERTLMVHPVEYATPEELHAALVMWLIEIQIHETREFFRVGPGLDAPYHPHRWDGDRQWDMDVVEASRNPMRGTMALGL